MVKAQPRESNVAAALCTLLVMAAGCRASPSDVYERMAEAAAKGDAEAFAACFDNDSRPFAQALLSLYTTHPAPGPNAGALQVLAKGKVKSEEILGQKASLKVETPDGRTHELVFVLEDGEWRIDAFRTEKANSPPL